MKFLLVRLPVFSLVLIGALLAFSPQLGWADQNDTVGLQEQFFKLCDVAAATVNRTNNRASFFVDSYAVRALCVAYDMTGKAKYLDACRKWSEQMVEYQGKMTPGGAYYMHYNRKPGETKGDWYVADSSSIGMALLATSVRCQGAEKERFLDSTKQFASLVISNYVNPDGGVTDGLWRESDDAWWCSSSLFGSFLFNLYANTGDQRYLDTGVGIVDWLNHWDLTKKQPFPLAEQGPAMLMYVMECYSAGWPYLSADNTRKKASSAKVSWCLGWMVGQQQSPIRHELRLSLRPPHALSKQQPPEKVTMQGPWPISKGWGMKFGGLPFHEYIFSQHLPDGEKLTAAGDAELQRLASVVFAGKPEFNQLSVFMMMSYAERLHPGAIYRAGKD
jgi:hypothetical protein